MKVTLVAYTNIVDLPYSISGTSFGEDPIWNEGTYSKADRLAHFSGRACYQAWEMPNPETRTDEGYLANILSQGHYSVLEHASATFYVEGISRSLTHELVRHRHLSYSQLSQRYVDMEGAEFVQPPALRDLGEEYQFDPEEISQLKESYAATVDILRDAGLTRKQAREAARAILPNNMETKIVVTGNHRAWRDMLQKRYSVHADAEIRELATELLRQLRLVAPGTYQDFPAKPFE